MCNLDFDTFQKLAHELNQTIIAVTHDNDFANKSDRIIEMMDVFFRFYHIFSGLFIMFFVRIVLRIKYPFARRLF